jgi:DNA-binding MarR family transcriptional regulator/GNAT superfamily N-acetyltransferase
MTDTAAAGQVSAIRAFTRLYTSRLGVVDGAASRPYSLAEVRVLREVAQRERATAGEIARALDLDAGYVSRIVRGFERRRQVRRTRAPGDGRQKALVLTAAGRRAFAALDRRANRDVAKLLEPLTAGERQALAAMLERARRMLGGEAARPAVVVLRPPEPGDMGWVVGRQARLYADEYGWNQEYEALAAEIVAKFIREFDPQRERCWIAEREGERLGAVFCARAGSDGRGALREGTAKLRLLHVEQAARGLGIGQRLVEECVRFARRAGYGRMELWTQSNLVAARHIYERAGFVRVKEEAHHSFGHDLVAETWAMEFRC